MQEFGLTKIILERDNHTCIYCQGAATLVHTVVSPKSGGPVDSTSNLVSICKDCYQRKDTLEGYILQGLRYLIQREGNAMLWLEKYMHQQKRPPTLEIECLCCGIKFMPYSRARGKIQQRFCSKSCRVTYWNKTHYTPVKDPVETQCPGCGIAFLPHRLSPTYHRRKYCSGDCRNQARWSDAGGA